MKKTAILGMLAVMILMGCGQRAEKRDADAAAGFFEPNLSLFQTAFEKKDFAGALLELQRMAERIWKESPLLLRNARFVKSGDNTYGVYDPKENEAFSEGELIHVYVEPAGYAVLKNKEGKYAFGFKADFTLEDDQGKVLGGQKDFADLSFLSWNFNTEVSLTFTYTFSGLSQGRYKIITLVKDVNSEKQATLENWFTRL